jgi:fumarate hydratase class II
MGPMDVPEFVHYGASTQRAVLNFPISDLRFPRVFIRALALIKLSAAEVNEQLGLLPAAKARTIKKAARQAIAGAYDQDMVVDIFQTGSGTSTNMNLNEVLASHAREFLGLSRSDRLGVHPNDDVNMGQSSNDVIPSATHLAALLEINEHLLPALHALRASLNTKSQEFMGIVKTGRTHLQDATPILLGQEFSGYSGQIERAIAQIEFARFGLSELALGGTAVGTGINTHKEFASRVCGKLSRKVKFKVRETSDHFQAQSSLDAVVATSGALRALAVALMKIANDVRWLGSGPRAGLGEIQLPEVQPGSSIMPGKVNPVIAESVCQVAAQVMGNDQTIGIAGQSGLFELNVMQPVAAYNLLQSIALLAASCDNFRQKCIDGLSATERGPALAEHSLALATALVPHIGYDKAAELSHVAAQSGRSIKQVAAQMTTLSAEELDIILDPLKMVHPEG